MIGRFASGGPWEQTYGYSRAVRAGDLVVTAGCTSTVDGAVTHPGDAYAQTRTAFGVALTALRDAGGHIGQVTRTRMYVTDRAHADALGRAHGEVFGAVRPAATMVIVAGLLDPAMLVEVELEAVLS